MREYMNLQNLLELIKEIRIHKYTQEEYRKIIDALYDIYRKDHEYLGNNDLIK
tara:strand:- start:114 stop:272 length:159 start_codon:yes stop_codon:yes gene_type:complete